MSQTVVDAGFTMPMAGSGRTGRSHSVVVPFGGLLAMMSDRRCKRPDPDLDRDPKEACTFLAQINVRKKFQTWRTRWAPGTR